jgi:hypothetical protein
MLQDIVQRPLARSNLERPGVREVVGVLVKFQAVAAPRLVIWIIDFAARPLPATPVRTLPNRRAARLSRQSAYRPG